MAMEARGKAGRAQAGGEHQGPGAGDCQVDTGGGLFARPGEVEKMIRSRLEEKSWSEEKEDWQKEREEVQWLARFCLGGVDVVGW